MKAFGVTRRPILPFHAVNRKGQAGYDRGLQRHHLLPRQLQAARAFSRMFAAIGGERRRFDDFRENGLLLPCDEDTALRLAMPLHRGPHRRYSELVIERAGQIEAGWAIRNRRDSVKAGTQAHMRLGLLQRALRRYLLAPARRRLLLNRRDPFGTGADFSELDAMVDALWTATDLAMPSSVQPAPVRERNSSLAA